MFLPRDQKQVELARNCLALAAKHLQGCWPRPETSDVAGLKMLLKDTEALRERLEVALGEGRFPEVMAEVE